MCSMNIEYAYIHFPPSLLEICESCLYFSLTRSDTEGRGSHRQNSGGQTRRDLHKDKSTFPLTLKGNIGGKLEPRG